MPDLKKTYVDNLTATAEGTVIDLGDSNTVVISGINIASVGGEDFTFF